jgi:3-hydroxyisobutyrate dehydrogenase-like beta-hydroxyacid dehydrogenase
VIVGVLHPGEMGAAIGAALRAAGDEVRWASEGRSDATRARAAAFTDAGSVAEVDARCDVVFSVVPPHAAVELVQEGRDACQLEHGRPGGSGRARGDRRPRRP